MDKSKYLDEVIDCILENKPKIIHQELPQLYGQANKIIQEFDHNITRCKKYNQAKINRKYQIIISDLQAQIRKLNQKLKLEQEARSPTKKHISEILDKLVSYKDNNQILKSQLQIATQRIKQLEENNNQQSIAIQKISNQQNKSNIERLPSLNSTNTVDQAVKLYLKEKYRNNQHNSKSNFEKFLDANRAKMWNWTIANLLQEIDKWGEGIRQKHQKIDMWKIRSNIARKFSDQIDDSRILIAPSHYRNSHYLLNTPTNINPSKNMLNSPSSISTPKKINQMFQKKSSKKKLSALSIKKQRQKRSLQSSLY